MADFTSRERQSYLAVWPWEKGGGRGGGQQCALTGNHGNKGLGTSKTNSRVWRQSSGALAFVFQVSVLSVGHHVYVLECHHSGQPGGL